MILAAQGQLGAGAGHPKGIVAAMRKKDPHPLSPSFQTLQPCSPSCSLAACRHMFSYCQVRLELPPHSVRIASSSQDPHSTMELCPQIHVEHLLCETLKTQNRQESPL